MKILSTIIFAFIAAVSVARGQTDGYVQIVFAGDMMQHDAQIAAAYDSATNTYDYSDCFRQIEHIIKGADLAVCNFEVTLAGKPYKGYPSFSAPDEFFEAIAEAGFGICLTANNHCLDKGRRGLERTIATIGKNNVAQAGTYTNAADRQQRYPLMAQADGMRIAMLNYTYGTNGLKPTPPNVVNFIDTAIIKRDIAEARKHNPDYIIANMHWGVEYSHTPNKQQRSMAKWLIENGVDHVVGSHPHVVQPAEVITTPDGRKHYIIYSLGNVISNQQRPGTNGGILFGLELPADKTQDARCWYTSFIASKPAESGLENYIVFPTGTDADMPDGERQKLDDFARHTRTIMATGDTIEERQHANTNQ